MVSQEEIKKILATITSVRKDLADRTQELSEANLKLAYYSTEDDAKKVVIKRLNIELKSCLAKNAELQDELKKEMRKVASHHRSAIKSAKSNLNRKTKTLDGVQRVLEDLAFKRI